MKCLGYSIEIAENSDIQIMKILIYIIAKAENSHQAVQIMKYFIQIIAKVQNSQLFLLFPDTCIFLLIINQNSGR